jgi:hypothetical protein
MKSLLPVQRHDRDKGPGDAQRAYITPDRGGNAQVRERDRRTAARRNL